MADENKWILEIRKGDDVIFSISSEEIVLFTHDNGAVKIMKVAAEEAQAFLSGVPDVLPKVNMAGPDDVLPVVNLPCTPSTESGQ